MIGPAAAALAAALATALLLASPLAVAGVSVLLAALVAWVAWRDVTTFTIPDPAVAALAGAALVLRWHGLPGGELAGGGLTGEGLVGGGLAGGGLAVEGLARGGLALAGLVLAVDLALSAGLLWLVREAFHRRRGVDALGFGDVKLAGALGLWLGAGDFALALLVASLAGLGLAGVAALNGRPVGRATKLPFGALLAPAGFAVWRLVGPAIEQLGSA